MPSDYPKYIVLKQDKVIMFSNMFNHNEIMPDNSNIIAAGFFDISPTGHVKCFGHSQTLGIASREALDEMLIEQALRIGHIHR